ALRHQGRGRERRERPHRRGPGQRPRTVCGRRIIDVSKEAARKLGMVEDGVTEVEVAPVPTDSVDDPGEPIVE
ncbi:hypothetical protein, partial [Methyloceanibacter marginalis]|uniref:hypothetical protein n=1 Tax=Methyloceanibacter marginalis TaxID=1774971 RepID=UPI00195B2212